MTRVYLWLAAAALVAAGLLLSASGVRAEPYMAVREGYKCSKCHVNKTGGGKRTDFAIVYMQTRAASSSGLEQAGEAAGQAEGEAEQGKDVAEAIASGDFAHGHLNDSFSVGADLRAGYYSHEASRENAEQRFDREAACESCHASADGGGKRGELYFQADLLPERFLIYAGENLLPRVNTRELFAMLEGLPMNGYVKAGTFRLPAAFNRYYDDPFVHGVTSGDTQYISPRGVGIEAGIEPGPFALSLSVTNAGLPEAPVESSAKRQSALGYAVFKFATLGGSYVVDPTSAQKERRITGAFGGLHAGRFTALAELDWIDQDRVSDSEDKTYPAIGTAELNCLISKGQNVKLLYEYYDPDRKTDGDLRDRTSLIYEPFVYPYAQFRLGYREAVGPVGDSASNYKKYFVELHAIY